MNKKQDLLNVFSFIAEFLREENSTANVGTKKLLVETSTLPSLEKAESNILNHLGVFQSDTLTKLKSPIDNLGKDAKHIKDLMDRVDAKDKEQAVTNILLSTQRKTFENEIKNLKEEYSKKLETEKIEDTENTGNTQTTIRE
jgi:hypothetical protein